MTHMKRSIRSQSLRTRLGIRGVRAPPRISGRPWLLPCTLPGSHYPGHGMAPAQHLETRCRPAAGQTSSRRAPQRQCCRLRLSLTPSKAPHALLALLQGAHAGVNCPNPLSATGHAHRAIGSSCSCAVSQKVHSAKKRRQAAAPGSRHTQPQHRARLHHEGLDPQNPISHHILQGGHAVMDRMGDVAKHASPGPGDASPPEPGSSMLCDVGRVCPRCRAYISRRHASTSCAARPWVWRNLLCSSGL